ncbi:MAG TPA: hypothetical protein DCQ83_05565 [Fibrobacteres bacterium]|nr:hypothetical protein [Fibrobacterota bacterium]
MKKFLHNDVFIGLVLSLAALGVYLLTLAPGLTFIDSGELATDAQTLGIAHPTGYPLFTLLGWLFAHLPIGGRVIWKLNLMSAVLCAAAVFSFYRLFLFLLVEQSAKGKVAEQSFLLNRLAAATAALVLAFSETYWTQSTAIEVYPLHLLFLALVLWLFLRAMTEHARKNESGRWWLAFAFVLGLSFTNHMTTILLAPGLLYLFFAGHGFSSGSWKKIVSAVIPFLIGLSVYLYFPIRASQSPEMNWGNPVSLERMLWHISGKQFRVWMFSSFDSAGKQFGHFVSTFLPEFGYLPLALALIGLVYLFGRSRKMFVFTLLLFLGCLFYSVNYDIHDIDSYFLLAYVTTAIWIAFGLSTLLLWAWRRGNGVKALAGIACIACILLPLSLNYRSVDESRDYAVEDYARNVLETAEPNAVILSYQWDAFVSAAYYLQLVEGFRRDVVVIDRELLRRSWYYEQLGHRYPWLIENSRVEVQSFLAELDKFEHDVPYNPGVIQGRFEVVIRSLLLRSSQSRPVYVTPEIEPEFVQGFRKVPSGLAFRLLADTTPINVSFKDYAFRPILKSTTNHENVKSMYAMAYVNQGIFRAMQGGREEGLSLVRKALALKPDYGDALVWLDRLSNTR